MGWRFERKRHENLDWCEYRKLLKGPPEGEPFQKGEGGKGKESQ